MPNNKGLKDKVNMSNEGSKDKVKDKKLKSKKSKNGLFGSFSLFGRSKKQEGKPKENNQSNASASAPASNIASAPANNIASAPANNIASAPANNIASAPASNIASAPASNIASAPANNIASAPASFRSPLFQSILGGRSVQPSNQASDPKIQKLAEENKQLRSQLEQLNSQLLKEQKDKPSRETKTTQQESETEVRGSTPDGTPPLTSIQIGAQFDTTRPDNSTEKSDEEAAKEELLGKIMSLNLRLIFGEKKFPLNDSEGNTKISEEFAYYFLGKYLGKYLNREEEEDSLLDRHKTTIYTLFNNRLIMDEIREEIESQRNKLEAIYDKKFTGKDSATDIILSFSIGSEKDLLQKIVKGEYLGKVDNKNYLEKMSNMQEVMRKLKTTKSRFSKEHRFLKRLKKKMHKKTQRIIKFTKLQEKSQSKQQVLLKMQITRGIYKFLKKDVGGDLSKISREGMLKAIENKLNKLDESGKLFNENKEMLKKQVDQLMKSFHDSPGNLKSVKKAIMKQLKREENKLAKESGVYGGFLKRAYRFFTFHKLDDEAINDAYEAEKKLQEREANRLGKFEKTDKILQKAWSRLQKIQAKENVKKSVKGLLKTPQDLKISDVSGKRTVGRSQ